jgi:hypothetical protein
MPDDLRKRRQFIPAHDAPEQMLAERLGLRRRQRAQRVRRRVTTAVVEL